MSVSEKFLMDLPNSGVKAASDHIFRLDSSAGRKVSAIGAIPQQTVDIGLPRVRLGVKRACDLRCGKARCTFCSALRHVPGVLCNGLLKPVLRPLVDTIESLGDVLD